MFSVCLIIVGGARTASAQAIEEGREFPKTLTFDEPGIDDEVSLPTVIFAPRRAAAGREMDFDVELDKRLTPRASVQINVGYTRLPLSGAIAGGWQNVQVTLKYVALEDAADERLASVSLAREFGGSGATRIGASPTGSTMLAANFGQGFSPFSRAAWIRPFAVTGSLGYAVPDRAGPDAFQQAVGALSVQYSVDVLASHAPDLHLAASLRPLIPVVECVFTQPVARGGPSATVAPGLIYGGEGFQLALEALIPLTRTAGTHAGFIAQLNLSLGVLGIPQLAHPIWQ